MHPILSNPRRLMLYVVAWTAVTTTVVIIATIAQPALRREAMALFLPPSIVFAFVCLAAWYPARALPVQTTNVLPLVAAHAVGTAIASSALLLLTHGWSVILRTLGFDPGEFRQRAPLVFACGILLYLISVAVQYLLIGMERARETEARALEALVLAREAELRELRSQIDPHFLFNSLNSISSLCGSNPASARTMSILLAEYLRKSLRLGKEESIPLSDEIELASSYLAIERIRFGDRLQIEQQIDEDARECRVPPLVILPLVENAVTHGIAHRVEGGTVRVAAERRGSRLAITIENDADADRPASRGSGIGLANVKRRVAMFFGDDSRVDVLPGDTSFLVELVVPALVEDGLSSPSGRTKNTGGNSRVEGGLERPSPTTIR